MELDQELNLNDFIISTLTVYVNNIGTEKDTQENYLSIYDSIQDYKYKVPRQDFKKFLTEIQIVLNVQNKNYYRKNSGEFLLDIIKLRSSIEFIIGRWNDYQLDVHTNLKENHLQTEEIENIKNSRFFYLFFENNNDEFTDPQKIVSNRELLVGDILNFSDHELLENLEYVYKTLLFKIVKREYSVVYGEMSIYLIPYIE